MNSTLLPYDIKMLYILTFIEYINSKLLYDFSPKKSIVPFLGYKIKQYIIYFHLFINII